MTGSGNKFDPGLLQARWVLGGLNAEELTDQAVLALEQGFGGTALQQLAGLVRPAQRDLGDLPERAFAEMGLEPISKDQAVTVVIARGGLPTCGTISTLLIAFPDLSERWRTHVALWGGKPAGSYNDMHVFVEFTLEALYEKGNLERTRRVFRLLERLFIEGDQEVRNLIGLGFFESLRNIASRRPYGSKPFEEFMGPTSIQIWREIERQWRGKSSLADVIRAERQLH
jgi:hypothetical protein